MREAPSFVDTNVLVYAVDRDEPEKRQRAVELLAATPHAVISAQVLGEFFVTVTRKLRPAFSDAEVRSAVSDLARLAAVPIEVGLVQAAIATVESAQISYWDALIVEAAVASGCQRIYTEDLTDGQVIRGVEIVNPFA